jgi:uncharacterized protein (TIGR02246 family)
MERLMATSPGQLHGALQDAFNRQDVESIVALYEDDAVIISLEGPVRGTDAIRKWYRGALASRPTMQVHTLGVHVAGSLAMLHGKWIVREPGTAADRIRRAGVNTETARLQPDGRWLFVIDNPSVPVDTQFGPA